MSKQRVTASNIRLRKSFSKVEKFFDIPNLIGLQRDSYEKFLLKNIDHDKRPEEGLNNVLKSIFPIIDFNKTSRLEFVSYDFSPPKYDVEECRQRGMTYASLFKIVLRLIIFDNPDEDEKKEDDKKQKVAKAKVVEDLDSRNIRDVKEQEVYLGEIPLMTENGSFIINGVERVVVSQLHRSPGVFFDHDGGKGSTQGKLLYSARIIPYRGSWLDFEFDQKDILYARIDRRRKFPCTIVLKALGFSTEELLDYFYNIETVSLSKGKAFRKIDLESMRGMKANVDIVHPKTKEVLVKKDRRNYSSYFEKNGTS